MKLVCRTFAVLIAACVLPAAAETLYKLIDKNGKVTYSESAPKNFDGQVIRIDIDPNANTATLPKPPPAKGEETGRQRPQSSGGGAAAARNEAEARVRQAQAKVEGTRRALQEARDNPGEEDVQFIGKKGGGARPVASDEYQDRLAKLEQAVKDAEEELRRAEKEL